jgi:predicted neuraminidase
MRRATPCLIAVLALAFAPLGRAEAAPASAIVRTEFIHEPAAYPQCHASTIAEADDGTLVAAWFGGTREGNPDVCIWMSRLESGVWSREAKVADGIGGDGRRWPCWNPVLFQPRQGPLLLFYKVGPSPETWWGMMKSSTDRGQSWSAARRLPEGILGPIKDKPIQLADGTLLCGSSTEAGAGRVWRVHLERTPDLGATWKSTGDLSPGDFNAIQPTILTHADGRLQLLCRSKEMTLTTSWSSDQGLTWTPLAASGLYAPNSGIDAVTLRDGRQLLVYNRRERPHTGPAASKAAALGGNPAVAEPKEDWGARWPLNVAVSSDGVTWKMVLVLEDEPRKDGYAYPAVIQTRDGLVHITYTWGRVRIKHVVLDPKRL